MGRRIKRGETLLIATHNRGKLGEFAELLAPFGVKTVSAATLRLDEPEETGTTFEANARLKAAAAVKEAGIATLADDSGLTVEALGGAPGIYSARWAGPQKDFVMAMRRIEECLAAAGVSAPASRRASFVAVLCLALPDGDVETFAGEVAGTLVWPPRGSNGFGYDPMFVPDGHERSFGEMSAAEKHALSHRARAFARFAAARLPS